MRRVDGTGMGHLRCAAQYQWNVIGYQADNAALILNNKRELVMVCA
jgi:hypothetical protein